MKCLVSDKLGPKSDKCYFVGYPIKTKGYHFYKPSENKVYVAQSAVFLERELVSRRNSGRKIDLDNTEPELVEHEQNIQDNNSAQETQVVLKSSRIHHEPKRYYGFLLTQNDDDQDEPCVYKRVSGSHLPFLILYVVDILLIGNDIPSLQDNKTWIGKSFFSL